MLVKVYKANKKAYLFNDVNTYIGYWYGGCPSEGELTYQYNNLPVYEITELDMQYKKALFGEDKELLEIVNVLGFPKDHSDLFFYSKVRFKTNIVFGDTPKIIAYNTYEDYVSNGRTNSPDIWSEFESLTTMDFYLDQKTVKINNIEYQIEFKYNAVYIKDVKNVS